LDIKAKPFWFCCSLRLVEDDTAARQLCGALSVRRLNGEQQTGGLAAVFPF
jgi:hypothetical protein